MDIDFIAIGRRIRQERVKRQWSQRDLSDHTQISTSHISCIERGLSGFTIGHLAKMAEAFNMSIDYLLRGEVISESSSINAILQIVQDCNVVELQIILENVNVLKQNLRKFFREFDAGTSPIQQKRAGSVPKHS